MCYPVLAAYVRDVPRRNGRVVEGGSLENCCAERYRGFESYFLRHMFCLVLAMGAGFPAHLGHIRACRASRMLCETLVLSGDRDHAIFDQQHGAVTDGPEVRGGRECVACPDIRFAVERVAGSLPARAHGGVADDLAYVRQRV